MGLVDILLPLPSSHYLITKSMINAVSPIYYDKANAIKKDLNKISKNNKKLKNTDDPRLASLRLVFDHIRAAWLDQNATWVALDFEAWEMYHHDLTEFGYAMVRFHKGKQVESEEEHWIVLDRQHLRNVSVMINPRSHDVRANRLLCNVHPSPSIWLTIKTYVPMLIGEGFNQPVDQFSIEL